VQQIANLLHFFFSKRKTGTGGLRNTKYYPRMSEIIWFFTLMELPQGSKLLIKKIEDFNKRSLQF
jgi:hypothetical protein